MSVSCHAGTAFIGVCAALDSAEGDVPLPTTNHSCFSLEIQEYHISLIALLLFKN